MSNKLTAIDIGTNSVKLLIARIEPTGRIKPLKEIVETTRLGRNQEKTGRLAADGAKKTIKVLKNFVRLARKYQANKIIAAATDAVRHSKNKNVFLKKVFQKTGLKVKVLTARQEACLTYRGVVSGYPRTLPQGANLVIDIGGGSTELVWGAVNKPAGYQSFPLGAVKLTERFIHHDPITEQEYTDLVLFIRKQIASVDLTPWLKKHKSVAYKKNLTIIGAGGTMVALEMLRRKSKKNIAETSRPGILSLQQVMHLTGGFKKNNLTVRRKTLGPLSNRADIILAGAVALLCLMEQLKLERIVVSPRGLRYGLIHRLAQIQ